MKSKQAQTAFAVSKMKEITLLNRANIFEASLFSWGIPKEAARELTSQHSELTYGAGKIIFSQGSSADIVLWVIKGVVREICPNPNGTQTLMRLATTGDILGLADKLNEKGHWTRRFEAWTATNCVLGFVTRQQLRNGSSTTRPSLDSRFASGSNWCWVSWDASSACPTARVSC